MPFASRLRRLELSSRKPSERNSGPFTSLSKSGPFSLRPITWHNPLERDAIHVPATGLDHRPRLLVKLISLIGFRCAHSEREAVHLIDHLAWGARRWRDSACTNCFESSDQLWKHIWVRNWNIVSS